MFHMTLPARHAVTGFLQSILVQAAPYLSAMIGFLAPAPPKIAHADVTYHGILALSIYAIECAVIRGVQAWLTAQHAPQTIAAGVVPGAPVVKRLESVVVLRPVTPIAPQTVDLDPIIPSTR